MTKSIGLPGFIDIHAHFRDPGQTHKEDFYTGTLSAISGGVTTVFDMPNNKPPVTSSKTLNEKLKIASRKAVSDYGLYFGTDGKNLSEFDKVASKVIGLKLYLEETTGNLEISDEDLTERIFRLWPKRKIIIIHGTGKNIELALSLAARYRNKIHITHVSTEKDLSLVIDGKKQLIPVTCDVTPHHLFLTEDNLSKLGSYGLVKPALSSGNDQKFLWSNLAKIDCISSDHAPHTIEEKRSDTKFYGMPGIETMIPLLLTAVNEKLLKLEDIVRLVNINPQKILGFIQDNNNYIEVDMNENYILDTNSLKSKSGWSPYAGRKMKGRIKKVYLHGQKVFDNGSLLVKMGYGKLVV